MATSNNGNVQWFPKKVTESRIAKYGNQLAVIVTKSGRIIFSKEAIRQLGEPAYIAVGQRGSNIVLTGATSEQGWKVTYHAKERSVDPYISVNYLMKRWGLPIGAFECHTEGNGDLLVFDQASKPSK